MKTKETICEEENATAMMDADMIDSLTLDQALSILTMVIARDGHFGRGSCRMICNMDGMNVNGQVVGDVKITVDYEGDGFIMPDAVSVQ